MAISRKNLYAAGEPFGNVCTRRKIGKGLLCGGGDSSSSTAGPQTTNTDNRMALDDSVGVGAGASVGNVTVYAADAQVLQTLAETLPDAVNFMVNAGADVIDRAGGAVVELNRDSIKANSKSFDSVVNFGAQAVDRILTASQENSALASQVVASYQPDNKNNAETAKYAMFAAAGLVAVVLLNNGKKA